jgi:hypothetical protein
MQRMFSYFVLAFSFLFVGCGSNGNSGSGGGGTNPPPPSYTSYAGTTGYFVAWANPSSGTYASASMGTYAGKKQVLHGSVDFLSGASLSQPAGVEVYKGSDGHIYALDVTSTSTPAAAQISSETAATTDDLCSFTGTSAGAGADYDYAGIFFSADLQTPTNSSYFYRLPGPDGVCNTPDDIIHLVKTGWNSTNAPIVATGMPVTAVHNSSGGLTGFVVKNGNSLTLVDSNSANPVTLGTFANPIGVAVALPVGTIQGYPTGQLFVVDGNIVYVNYSSPNVSAPLFTIPNWSPTNAASIYAASPTTLYFAINTAASGQTPASASIYSMPANGSSAPTLIDNEPGRIVTLSVPVNSTNLLWGIENNGYSVESMLLTGGNSSVVVTSTNTDGTFIATASTVYYTTWIASFDSATNIYTRNGTTTGIIGINGNVIQQPLPNSTFLSAIEDAPWPADTVTTQTPTVTVFQVQGLSTVTVTNSTTGEQYVEDAISGGTLMSIDTTSNQTIATLGTFPNSTAVFGTDTFRNSLHTGFFEAYTPVSTQAPPTRDLYLFNSQTTGTLTRVTGNL